jgi:hypothetical protein
LAGPEAIEEVMYRREECLVQASICREKAEYLSPVLSGNVFLTHQIATSHTCANANRGFFSRLVPAQAEARTVRRTRFNLQLRAGLVGVLLFHPGLPSKNRSSSMQLLHFGA